MRTRARTGMQTERPDQAEIINTFQLHSKLIEIPKINIDCEPLGRKGGERSWKMERQNTRGREDEPHQRGTHILEKIWRKKIIKNFDRRKPWY